MLVSGMDELTIFYKYLFLNFRTGSFCATCFRLVADVKNKCESCGSVKCDEHVGMCDECVMGDPPALKCCGEKTKDAKHSVECLFCLGRVHPECVNFGALKEKEPAVKGHTPGTVACFGPYFACKRCQKHIGM